MYFQSCQRTTSSNFKEDIPSVHLHVHHFPALHHGAQSKSFPWLRFSQWAASFEAGPSSIGEAFALQILVLVPTGGSTETFPQRSEKCGTFCVSSCRSCFIEILWGYGSFYKLIVGWNLKSFCKGFTFHRWFNLLLSDLHHKDSIPGPFRVTSWKKGNLGSIWHGFLWFPILKSDGSIPCTWQKERKVLRFYDDVFCFQDSHLLFLRPYSFFENFSSPSHEGNDPTSAWNIWNGFGNSGNRYVAPYAWRSTWIRLRSRWWVELSWVELLWLFFVEKKEAVETCWNIFLLEGITGYHTKQKKDMGQFSDSEFPLGKKVKPSAKLGHFWPGVFGSGEPAAHLELKANGALE